MYGWSLREVRPTYFFAVPRVWEKFEEAMVAIGRKNTGVKKVKQYYECRVSRLIRNYFFVYYVLLVALCCPHSWPNVQHLKLFLFVMISSTAATMSEAEIPAPRQINRKMTLL